MVRIAGMSESKFSGLNQIGDRVVEAFHLLGLFVVGATIVWSAVVEYLHIITKGHASLGDILLLFIYLELGAMVGIFFRTHRIPVVFLLFITITAMTRFLAIDIKVMSVEHTLAVSASILLLTLAILVLRYSSKRFSTSHDLSDEDGLGGETSDG